MEKTGNYPIPRPTNPLLFSQVHRDTLHGLDTYVRQSIRGWPRLPMFIPTSYVYAASSNRVKSRPTNRVTEKLIQKATQTVLPNGGKTTKRKILPRCSDSPTKLGNSPVVQKRPPITFVQNERCAVSPSPATSPNGGTVSTDWNENDLSSSDVSVVLRLVLPPTKSNFISSIKVLPESSKPIALLLATEQGAFSTEQYR
ncbi:hypothetical protein CLF_107734 [Clonorchis sinensis]|uniref:Uncharacterized protein n=1 Tax=Clonorchis sinensis TaxID=79923 RepID=G7YH43_CLOSI|nr:hypothetical protein CLF_107734 [Clonorchis sinensis]